MPDRSKPPITYSPQQFDYILNEISVETLDNGIPFYSLSDSLEPVLQLELVFDAGGWYESANGVAQATASLFKSGTSRLNSFQISETFEQYGASVKAHCGSDWASVSISCLTRHLDKLLPLVYELLTDSLFPQSELDIYIRNARERLSMNLVKSDFVANRKIDEFLFGLHHPYGRYMVVADSDAIRREDLLQHLKNLYTSTHCKMFLAGQFSDLDKKLINQQLGAAPWNNATRPVTPVFTLLPEPVLKHRVHHDDNSVQGSVRLGRPFPHKTHPDYVPMVVLNTVFGGYFGSRLMSNIREEKGYTYGIHSFLLNNKNDTAFMISTEAGKDVCEKVIEEIYKEMALLRTELVDAEEMDLVKNYLLGSILGGLDGSFNIIQRWKSLILNGFGKERFYNNIEIYITMTPELLQSLAQKYLNPEEYYELVVA